MCLQHESHDLDQMPHILKISCCGPGCSQKENDEQFLGLPDCLEVYALPTPDSAYAKVTLLQRYLRVGKRVGTLTLAGKIQYVIRESYIRTLKKEILGRMGQTVTLFVHPNTRILVVQKNCLARDLEVFMYRRQWIS